MDPLSAAEAASELAGLFVTIVKYIKEVIESIKGARKALIELLNRSERMRLKLELFRSLASRLREPAQGAITLTFNDEACHRTASDLYNLVHKVASAAKHSDIWMRLNWVFYKGDAAALTGKLEEQERDFNSVLMFIAAHSSVTTEHEVSGLKTQVEQQSRVTSAFEALDLGGDVSTEDPRMLGEAPSEYSHEDPDKAVASPQYDDNRPSSAAKSRQTSVTTRKPALWLGHKIREGFPSSYLQLRDTLANAAYRGDWHTVITTLEVCGPLFGESWSNAFRLKPENEADRVSGWTPLHQAAYMCAPVEVVEKILELGAFKTLPTAWADVEFRFFDMTAAGIARELGFSHLYDILAPIIRHHIPGRTLADLQDQFHHLISAELEGKVAHLRLPELSVLTELEDPLMWFPVQTGTQHGRGFVFRLDGRELLVRSIGKRGATQGGLFRVTTTGWNSIEDAIVFGA